MSSVPNTTVRQGRRHRCPSICQEDERAPLLYRSRSAYADSRGPRVHQDTHYHAVPIPTSTPLALRNRGQHCHPSGSNSSSSRDSKAWKQLLVASCLCLVLMIGEIVGGFLAHSLAIATDAAHLLTDLASFIISLASIYLARQAPTKKMHFGWYRAEVMGALISVVMIWLVTGVLVYLAVLRVIHQDFEINATVMLITAGCAVGFNILLGLTLHQHGHSHGGHDHSHGGHDHSHGSQGPDSEEPDEISDVETSSMSELTQGEGNATEEHRIKRKSQNINVRAAFIHVLGDLFQSIGVLTAAFIIYYKPEWKLADPICTFVFSVLVVITTFSILKDTMNVLMEGAPKFLSYHEVKKALRDIKGVKEVHNLRVWLLSVDKTALAVHLAVDLIENPDAQTVLSQASEMLRQRYGIYESTIQIEAYVAEMDDCNDCQDPRD